MAVRTENTEVHLAGDWTVSNVEANMDSLLFSLDMVKTSGARRLNIDCGQIAEADTSGLQLLNVLMLCARLRGVEPKLVNMNNGMKLAIQKLGLRHCISGNCREEAGHRNRGTQP